MKNKFDSRLRNVAAHLKKVGSKAGFRTIASALSLCLVAGMIAIISGFAKPQVGTKCTITTDTGDKITGTIKSWDLDNCFAIRFEDGKLRYMTPFNLSDEDHERLIGVPKPKPRAHPPQPTLPSHKPLVFPMEYTSPNYNVKGTLLGYVDEGLLFRRNSDGYMATIRPDDMTDEEHLQLMGRPKPKPEPENLTAEQMLQRAKWARVSAAQKKLDKLPATELLAAVRRGDPDMELVLRELADADYENEIRFFRSRYPDMQRYYRSVRGLLAELEIRDGDEQVSLRPEFERLGVVARDQGDTLECYLHATWYMYQYQCLKNGLPAASYEQFLNTLGARPVPQELGGGLHVNNMEIQRIRPAGRRFCIQQLRLGFPTLERELVKHQLRRGRPCIMAKPGHGVLIIGFKVEGNTTTFEYLDSNGTGYKKESAARFSANGTTFSAWLK